MGILDNLEGAWDEDFQWESNPIHNKDNMGREKSWATEIFSETVCKNCSSVKEEEFFLDEIDFDK
jgi:hypothetical protein